MLQRRSMLPGSSGSAPGARATGMSDEQKSGIPRPQVGGLPRVAVGPSSPQEEGKEEVLKDEFIFPQPEPQPEPVLEDAKRLVEVRGVGQLDDLLCSSGGSCWVHPPKTRTTR